MNLRTLRLLQWATAAVMFAAWVLCLVVVPWPRGSFAFNIAPTACILAAIIASPLDTIVYRRFMGLR